MHSPDQRIRRGFPFPRRRAVPPALVAAVEGAENFEPQAGLVSDRQVLLEILNELKKSNNEDFNRPMQAKHTGAMGGIIARVPDLSTALTRQPVEITPTRDLHILDWPFELQQLEIRLHQATGPLWNVLRHGRRLRSPTPIKQIFITTSPGMSGFLEFTGGGIEISDWVPNILHPLSFENRPKRSRVENQTDFDFPQSIGALNQAQVHGAQGVITGPGATVMFDTIPANTIMRLHGTVSAEAAATAALSTDWQIDLQTALSANRHQIKRKEAGLLETEWPFDWGYHFDTVPTQIEFTVFQIGPAGNELRVEASLEVHPL